MLNEGIQFQDCDDCFLCVDFVSSMSTIKESQPSVLMWEVFQAVHMHQASDDFYRQIYDKLLSKDSNVVQSGSNFFLEEDHSYFVDKVGMKFLVLPGHMIKEIK